MFRTQANPSTDTTLNPHKSHLTILAECYRGGEHANQVLGCVENAWGLKPFLQQYGHQLIITEDCQVHT
jgi:hypothetical protein